VRETNKKDRDDGATPAANPRAGRPTIGLLTYGPGDPNNTSVWSGADDAARRADVNLLCFPGKALRSPVNFESQANQIYDLVSSDTVDAVVVWGAALGRYVTPDKISSFFEALRPLPSVCIGLALEGIPCVLLDNYQGMYQATVHLIEAHGYDRIAFIRGPGGHPEAEERHRGFADALREHGVALDPGLVVAGDYSQGAGVAAMHVLIDERRQEFDAIVAANDTMALGALQALGRRGKTSPTDVAVVGFGDTEESKYATPPLTTVRPRAYEQAGRAVQTVLSLLRGERVPDQVTLPTDLAVRQSCGCLDPAVVEAAAESSGVAADTFEAAVAAHRTDILSDMAQAITTSSATPESDWMEQLLDTFAAELSGKRPDGFLTTLNTLLHRAALAGSDVGAWQRPLSSLRRRTLPLLGSDAKVLSLAQNLWRQARVMIAEATGRARMRQNLRSRQRADMMRRAGQSLVIASDIRDLTRTLARELPRLGVPSGYVSLYENPASPLERSNLILAYSEQGRIESGFNARSFPTRQLTPARMHSRGQRFSMSVEPLYFREKRLGLALFELRPDQADLCEPLRDHLSNALQAVLLTEERKRAEEDVHRRAAQAALAFDIGRRASSELELQSLFPEIVTGICDTFGYYTAMLLLLDDENQHLMLESIAGGYAGMFPDRPGIAVGRGMVGRAAATGTIQISGDVSQHPHYVRKAQETTRSELSVPIKSGQRVFGVLDLQSEEYDAFDQTDIMLMQTLANQVAAAIRNARLYAEVQRELAQRKQAEEAAQRRATQAALTNDVARRVSSELDLDSLLSEIVTAIRDVFDYYGVMLLLLDDDGRHLTLRSIAGAYVSTFPADLALAIGEGMIGHAAQTGATQLSRDITQNPHYVRKAQETTRSELAVPIKSGQNTIGVLDLQSDKRDAFDDTDVMLMETLADQVAIAIRNARLYKAIQRELAERRRAEQELLKLKEFNEGIVQTMAEALIIEDVNGRITFVNPAMERLVGYTTDELVGHHWRQIVSDRHVDTIARKTRRRPQGISDRYETRLRHKAGRETPVVVSALPLFQEGTFTGVLSAITDITEQQRAQEQLERYATELQESNEEVKQFAYIVSHDLRGPLVNLKGFAAELRSSLATAQPVLNSLLPHLDENGQGILRETVWEDVPEALDFIDSSATRMDAFINALLKLSRLGRRQLSPEPVDMSRLVRITLDSLAHQMEDHNAKVTVGELPTITADQTAMEQIMGNILGNAVKYFVPDRPGELVISAETGDEETTFHVRDNGRGIAESDMHKVFAPFRRAGRQDTPGEGMGLAYVQALVRRHGGRVWCESESGVGTTLSFTLPNRPRGDDENE